MNGERSRLADEVYARFQQAVKDLLTFHLADVDPEAWSVMRVLIYEKKMDIVLQFSLQSSGVRCVSADQNGKVTPLFECDLTPVMLDS
jgi:hypothetical protein